MSTGCSTIQCPFYLNHEEKVIICEGITDHCFTRLCFTSKRFKDQQMEIFCKDNYKYCEIYRMLMGAKYNE